VTSEQQNSLCFSISATFTAEPLRPVISFWGEQLQAPIEVRFAPYNQVHQTLLDPASVFALNTRGVNIVLVRLEDLGSGDQLEANVRHLMDDLRSAPERMSAAVIFCLCPSSPGFPNEAKLAAIIGAALDETPGLQYMHYDEIERLYPVADKHDPEGERLGHIPYTEAYYCALGTALVRRAHALLRPPSKLIALDCDNTLWQGICGEDGPEGVTLDAPRRALQCLMLEQREAGILLTMTSKNNEEDVLETFRVHPEFPLQPRHFVTHRLNWEPKASNLESIAEQLNIGTDSFIFVDDNPKECAELEQALPEVLTIVLPAEIGRAAHFLNHVWAFDRPVVTEEDRNRSAYYEKTAEFGNAIRKAGSLADFMATLKLRVAVAPMTTAHLSRVAQLTQRTNQFNTTTIRRTESEILSLVREGWRVYTAEVSDRFGDYGVVGAMIVDAGDSIWRLDSMLLSCRALGRGVEHRMLECLEAEAAPAKVKIDFVPSAKNKPAKAFIDSLMNPSMAQPTRAPAPASRASVTRAVDYTRIATELSTVTDILDAMRAPDVKSDAASDTERRLAQLWAELLGRPAIRRTDNFFDLGGHSLIAVLLLIRVRESFGVELSIDDVYTGCLTLADLAARIEAAQISGIAPEEYAALLAEIESLSDEEARDLLARESYDHQ
jgi:FkbH-like protein